MKIPQSYKNQFFGAENMRRTNDYAVLVLEEKIERQKYLKIPPSGWLQLVTMTNMMIFGYPSDKMLK